MLTLNMPDDFTEILNTQLKGKIVRKVTFENHVLNFVVEDPEPRQTKFGFEEI